MSEDHNWKVLEDAIDIAATGHQKQIRADGRPYIVHPVRMAMRLLQKHGPLLAAVAMLHDVVEDTDYTLDDLAGLFPQHVVKAVDNLTRRDGETYDDFVERCGANPWSRLVKMHDLRDNMRDVDEFKPSLRKRYDKALGRLEEIDAQT